MHAKHMLLQCVCLSSAPQHVLWGSISANALILLSYIFLGGFMAYLTIQLFWFFYDPYPQKKAWLQACLSGLGKQRVHVCMWYT